MILFKLMILPLVIITRDYSNEIQLLNYERAALE